MGTKGTWQRPAAITEAERAANWERTFRRPTQDAGSNLIRGMLEAGEAQQAEVKYRCNCGSAWAPEPAGGECTNCGSGITVRADPPTDPFICWASVHEWQPAPDLGEPRVLEGDSFTVLSRTFPAEIVSIAPPPPAE